MGRYSHLPAVLLALLADAAPRAYAHPIVRESLAARQTSNTSDGEPKRTSGPSVAAITGTAIGAGVIFFIFCFIVFWVYKRKPGVKRRRRGDVERGDAQRDGQGRPREAAQRGDARRREPQWPAAAVAPVQPVPVPGEHGRSASESPAFLPVMGERKREQGHKKEQQQRRGREQVRDQKQKQLKRSQTNPSPHQFAAELPAGEELRRPPMARINGFNMVLPPLLPPPTRPPNHPLPPTPPPTQPLPDPPTQHQQQRQNPLSAPLNRPTPPPTHPLPPIPTPTRPPRPDTPQLPPTRTRKPSRQNLTTAASPPRLAPLNTKDVRTPTTSRPRAGTGPREISPKTVLVPIHHQEQPPSQPQPQATPPHQVPQTPQQRPHTPQRQQYQHPHQHPHHQPTHAHHQRDQSQQTLIPSPDSAWSLSTFGAGNNPQDSYHPASVVTGSHADRFPVSPETPSGGGGTTGTVYVAFGERVPTQRTRKASVWTLQDSSDWPVPLAMTRHPTASDGRPRQAGGGSGGR